MKGPFSRIPAMLWPRTSSLYTQLPSHGLSEYGAPHTPYTDSSPLGSPRLTSASWRNLKRTTSQSRLSMGLRRISTKRILAICAFLFIVLILIVRGKYQERQRRIEEEAREREKQRNPFPWANFTRLDGFYSGIRTLIKYDECVQEQNAIPHLAMKVHPAPPLDPVKVDPYIKSSDHLKEYYPVSPCFLDEDEQVPAPDVFAYPGIPTNMTGPYFGSYEEIGVKADRCWERFGRFGPYGYSYNKPERGLGLSKSSERSGADKVEAMFRKVDYTRVNWGKAQKRCFEKNKHRFDSNAKPPKDQDEKGAAKKKALPRNAYVLRTWTGYDYSDIQMLSLRAMVNELSLKSGGEYDVHLLVHVKDTTLPIWASEEIYQQVLQKNVPEEFWGITTLWSEQQMKTYYPGPYPAKDQFENHSGQDIFGVYRSAHWALQWFAQQHPEYEFFWNWEMDVRYLGHYYEFHNGVSSWADKQPRKLLWERSSRWWIPSLHGSYEDFSRIVERETAASGAKPIWGSVEFPTAGLGMLPSPNGTTPPTPFEEDNYDWGVFEPADLITFDPLFDPATSSWGYQLDVTGYNRTLAPPPRRAAIVTIARLSRRLLNSMHEETWRMRHTMFPEMWPPSVALHHGMKAVYAPHPVYFDRVWPLEHLDGVFNHPKLPEGSPFGGGEHNHQGSSFYYNAGFSGALWRRWLGAVEAGNGGYEFEEPGTGRMCMRGLLHHPIKWERVA
ncbi:uncharacterized protein BCR38DRAFT_448664 [Pseudomassariella vexata]|uniref:Major facilitator superfamily transporter n=1 Tax=Pseudomassariella vexata TaxID=1141098 RepID=A0A1Y2DF22_9PEZI|nr:uncharacterized protein BCR38DRAFT_448664 [Pseudomassariella vexata]ORY57787.1 hypothetical protein BCR38DRAFT_448664 [Pseudomassariella vexata]